MLKYITKGNANPKGKPRVYFSCHPREYGAFLEPIAKELLAKQNCAVFYPETPDEARDEAFWEDLGQMQLFVMPVTTRLLTTENAAMEEFRFAISHHIPVLPLMQESGLEEVFNQKCGDLQFLDPNARDNTAIGYEEKLEKYLSSVLIGDELAAKVRAAFDAYVFLSYRKKDRRHAQELMRLIHSNEFARDIAIWYDEYLTPGENFNDAIRDALEKSQLFALAVTPSLLEEVVDKDGRLVDNYIVAHEYPMAKDGGKPILPVEMVSTDREALEAKYRDIPACTNGHDAPALSEALLAQLRRIALRENDHDLTHNYLIGLAYLHGIDVEVCYDRAVTLITSAAESGLLEAMTKLVEMYRNGMGVARSYETAIIWQEKKIEWMETAWNSMPDNHRNTPENIGVVDALFWAMYDCCMYYSELNNTAGEMEMCQRALKHLNHSDSPFDPKTARDRYICCERLGRLYMNEGELAKARPLLERCVKINRGYRGPYDRTGGWRADLASSYRNLGDLCKIQGDLAGAEKNYENAAAINREYIAQRPTVRARRAAGLDEQRLGSLYWDKADPGGAIRHYEKASAIFEELIAEEESRLDRYNLANVFTMLGDVYIRRSDFQRGQAFYEQALALRRELYEKYGTHSDMRAVSMTFERLGTLWERRKEYARALEYFVQAREMHEKLAEISENLESQTDLSISYQKIAGAKYKLGDGEGAIEYYGKARDILEKLAEKADTIAVKEMLAEVMGCLGRVHMGSNELVAAKACADRALELYRMVAAESDAIGAKHELTVALFCEGEICVKLSAEFLRERGLTFAVKDEEASRITLFGRQCLKEAVALAEEVAAAAPLPEHRYALAIAYMKVCYTQPFALWRNKKKARRILKQLVEEYPQDPKYRAALESIGKG